MKRHKVFALREVYVGNCSYPRASVCDVQSLPATKPLQHVLNMK